jgi:hypothetical protein
MRELLSTPERAWLFKDTWPFPYDPPLYLPLVFNGIQSGADGRFILENMEQGGHRIIATRRDARGRRQTVFADIMVGAGAQELVEIIFKTGRGTVEGYVLEDGSPVRNVVALIGDVQVLRPRYEPDGRYVFEDLLPGKYVVRMKFMGDRYEGKEIELAEGEHARVDIVVGGQGEIEASISAAGEAGRATAWYESLRDRILVLRAINHSGEVGDREIEYRLQRDAFKLTGIPEGSYEATAFIVVNINPFGSPSDARRGYWDYRKCRAQFVSEPQVVRVVSGSTVPVHLTVSEACGPHYPIPDANTCDARFSFEN